MPVLSGERLIGRVAARADRKNGVLVVEGHVRRGVRLRRDARAFMAAAIESLSSFAGAVSVSYAGPVAFGVS